MHRGCSLVGLVWGQARIRAEGVNDVHEVAGYC